MTRFFLQKKFLNNISIQWKLHISIATLLILMGISIIFVVERKVTVYFQQEHYSDIESIGRMVAANAVKPILTNDLMGLHSQITDALKTENELKYIYILTPVDTVLAHTFFGGFPADLLDFPAKFGEPDQIIHRKFATDEGPIHEVVFPIIHGEFGALYLGMSMESMLTSIADVKRKLIGITALLCLLGFIVSLIISRLITKPISSLVAATKRIEHGELDFEISSARNDEIGTLAKAFNDMAQALQVNLVKRQQTEKALKESKDLYLSLIENIDLGIVFIDKEHNIVIANSAQAKLFGVTAEEIIDQKCYEKFSKRSTICPDCPGVSSMSENLAVTTQEEIVRDDGTVFTIKVRTFPVKDDSGAILGFTKVVEDITEQLLLQDELQKIEQLESIGQLAGGIAHDFNNLLAAMLGNIELAQLDIAPEEAAAQRLKSAEEACGQARSLANQLLTFASGGVPRKTTTFVPQLLENSCKFALSGSNLKWVIDAPANIWPADLDEGQIGQVIQNLLINAKEASTARNKILVIAENIEIEDATEIPLEDGKYIKISIDDEGHGIKEEVLPKIFDPYFTTKEMGAGKGVGLGLTICHSIIKKHGGHISVKSEEGSGTSVSVYLPKSEVEGSSGPDGAISSIKNSTSERHRILLLEDDRELAKTTVNMLVHLCHNSEVTATGEEAISSYRQALNAGQPYDLLILDLTIRGGMGGNETLQKIRETDPAVRAIVYSGYSDDPIVMNFKDYGFVGALAKPFTLTELSSAIQSAFATGESHP